MKSLFTSLVVLCFVTAGAQTNKDDVALLQSIYGKEKRALIAEYMTLSDSANATKFWKVYDAYETERKKLGQDYIAILQNYASNFTTLDDSKADDLIKKASANNIAFEKLYKKYYKKMKSSVGALTASQFVQAEAYLRLVVKSAIMEEIPFVGDIDRKKVK